jgi:hypothetical protein
VAKPKISAEEARSRLEYDPISGWLKWRESPRYGINAGDRAGTPHGADGYRTVVVNRKTYREHRLAWLIHTGEWPEDEIDHINRDRQDNRWANLRVLNKAQNQQNAPRVKADTKTGLVGVYLQGGRWVARISKDKRPIHLGVFDSAGAALAARVEAELRLFEFSPLRSQAC